MLAGTGEHSAIRRQYVESCADFLSDRMGVPCGAVLGGDRTPEPALARMLIMLRVRSYGWSLPEIGKLFNRDHSTVHHGVTKAARLIRCDSELASIYTAIPAWGERVFTESSLTEKYECLTKLLAEAALVHEAIRAELSRQSVPTRVSA